MAGRRLAHSLRPSVDGTPIQTVVVVAKQDRTFHLGAADILGWVRADAAIDMGEADRTRRRSIGTGRSSRPPAGGLEHGCRVSALGVWGHFASLALRAT